MATTYDGYKKIIRFLPYLRLDGVDVNGRRISHLCGAVGTAALYLPRTIQRCISARSGFRSECSILANTVQCKTEVNETSGDDELIHYRDLSSGA
jgi:hypothetical protein